MRPLFAMLAVAAVAFIALIGWYKWDSSRNRGSNFGYYGEFNRVSNALASIPGVTVTRGWPNLDVSLEEFSFDIAVRGHSIRLFFAENDPVRSMRRDTAVATLQARIEVELGMSRTNK